jgi:hypothetical protein
LRDARDVLGGDGYADRIVCTERISLACRDGTPDAN